MESRLTTAKRKIEQLIRSRGIKKIGILKKRAMQCSQLVLQERKERKKEGKTDREKERKKE